MRNLNVLNSGFFFAWVLFLSVGFTSLAQNRANNPNQPPEIPDSEEWILIESTKGEMDWREVKQWYLNDLLQRKNDASVPNLKSITVEMLIKNSKFLEQAEKDDLLFFASEIVRDDRVLGNPMAIAKILKTAAGEKSTRNGVYPDLEIMKLAAAAEAKYADGADSAREEIKEEYKKSLSVLAGLHRDKWGESQLKGVDQ